MEIKNRLFPYPVLCDETDDYLDSEFNVEMTMNETMNDLVLSFDITLSNSELNDLIREGKAKYVLHLECSNTSYRKAIKTELNQINYNVPKSKVNKELSIVVMLVSTTDIINFFSSSLNEDYLGEQINFEHSSILAYQNMPKIIISKEYEELAGNESLFSIIRIEYPDPDEEHMLDIILDDDKIKIKVDAKTYDLYIKYQQSTALASSLFVLPALLHMIDVIREDDSCSNYESRHWFIKISKYYKSLGQDFIDDLLGNSRKSAVEMAQEMLKMPIGRAYRELSEIGE
ncbi:MAG: hypothetical protein MJ098_06000 [Saccharofermentans sp.]|nr:hypothetical protein [Saccharofermentans sp.]